MDPIKEFADRITRAVADLVRGAPDGSKLAISRLLLGPRFTDVAVEAIRRHVRRVLLDEREHTLSLLEQRHMGNLPLQALAADAIAEILGDINRAADPLRGAVVAGGAA